MTLPSRTSTQSNTAEDSEQLNLFKLASREQRSKPVPIYRPHGRWGWVHGEEILSADSGTNFGRGLEGRAIMKMGFVHGKEIIYISKLASVWDSLTPFFSTVFLNASSKYLRPLQGDCVPFIVNVTHCLGGCFGLNQELPHHEWWREADMFLREEQKEAIIAAYKKLHARQVLHGDAELRHMLIGADERVTLIDFGLSKVVRPDAQAMKARVQPCSPIDLEREMRKVKFLLNYQNSREIEFQRANSQDRDWCPRRNIENEPFLREELDEWVEGCEKWTAHRYEVIKKGTKASFERIPIPSPMDDRMDSKEQECSSEQKNEKGKGKAIDDSNLPAYTEANSADVSKISTKITNNSGAVSYPSAVKLDKGKGKAIDFSPEKSPGSSQSKGKGKEQAVATDSSSSIVSSDFTTPQPLVSTSKTQINAPPQPAPKEKRILGIVFRDKVAQGITMREDGDEKPESQAVPSTSKQLVYPSVGSSETPGIGSCTFSPTDTPTQHLSPPVVKEKRFLGIVFKGKVPQGLTLQEDENYDNDTKVAPLSDQAGPSTSKLTTDADGADRKWALRTQSPSALPTGRSLVSPADGGNPRTESTPHPAANERRFPRTDPQDDHTQGKTRKREEDSNDTDSEGVSPKKRVKLFDQSFGKPTTVPSSSRVTDTFDSSISKNERTSLPSDARDALLRFKNISRRYNKGAVPELEDEWAAARLQLVLLLPSLPLPLREMTWEDLGKPGAREILGLPPRKVPEENQVPRLGRSASTNSTAPLQRTISMHEMNPLGDMDPSSSRARVSINRQHSASQGPKHTDPRIAVLQQYGPKWSTETGSQETQSRERDTTLLMSNADSNAQAGPSSINTDRTRASTSFATPPPQVLSFSDPPRNPQSVSSNMRVANTGRRDRSATRLTSSPQFVVRPPSVLTASGPPQNLRSLSSNTRGAYSGRGDRSAIAPPAQPTPSARFVVPPPPGLTPSGRLQNPQSPSDCLQSTHGGREDQGNTAQRPATSAKRKREDNEDATPSPESRTDKSHPNPKKPRGDSSGSCSVM